MTSANATGKQERKVRKPVKFTDIGVRNLKPEGERFEVRDKDQRGLYLVVQPSGAKSWAVRYRFNGEPRKMTLLGVTLAQARKLAADVMFQVAQGIDPIKARKAEKDNAAIAAGNALQAVAETYMQLEGNKLRSRRDRRSIFERLIYPKLGHRPIGEIERDDVTALLDEIAVENGERMADMTLSVLRRLFSWHETRTSKFRSPLVRGMARLKPAERARDRILSDDEIRRVWAACGDKRLVLLGLCVRFLLLTAARRNEVAYMERGELAGNVWTLPVVRSKTKDKVVRPLSPAAMAILADVPQIAGSKFIFTVDGSRPVRLDAKRKGLLDRISGTTGWRIHDLRRTARTLLARARVPYDVAEQCLGHKLKGGLIRETYDQHDYLEERAEAFSALAAQVERVIHPPPEGARVIALRR
jgi:integrase